VEPRNIYGAAIMRAEASLLVSLLGGKFRNSVVHGSDDATEQRQILGQKGTTFAIM
jgi:hypothetical protein